ncbi:hypothetical protein IAU60_000485 [Kwoniella sp. DSM 27419]
MPLTSSTADSELFTQPQTNFVSPLLPLPSLPSPVIYTFTSPSKPSTPTSKSYHPYAIQTTASANLTRSNSSPAQPISVSGGHRPSRSMSSLNHILDSTDELGSEVLFLGRAKLSKDTEDTRRRSMDSPSRPGVKRSGTLPDFLLSQKSRRDKVEKEVDLPLNPKEWTPYELAQYLGHTLRTGGHDGTGQVLPAPLVEDIKSWVLRQRVTGRAFMKGSADGWGNTTRPPPFLPLLQSIARRLRRNSLTGRLDLQLGNNGLFRQSSVLMEEEEILSDLEPDEEDLTGVRRIANAFDARSSASEASASGDEGEEPGYQPQKLVPQWTGESVGERWKKWEEKGEVPGRWRNLSYASAASMASPVGETPASVESSQPDRRSNVNDDEQEDTAGATVKGLSLPILSPSDSTLTGLTPPPPYTSSFPDGAGGTIAPLPTLTEVLTPERSSAGRGGQYSATPTPERRAENTAGLGFLSPSPDVTPSKLVPQPRLEPLESSSPHMTNMAQHTSGGRNPYAALRRRSSSSGSAAGLRYPTIRSLALPHGSDDEGEEALVEPATRSPPLDGGVEREELEGSRWTTARRVTLRPGRVQGLFAEGSAAERSEVVSPTEGEVDHAQTQPSKVEDQMEKLMERVRELEDKLKAVSASTARGDDADQRIHRTERVSPSLLELMGFGSRSGANGEDPLPRRMRELPAYLFLVGVGVGAIMVRVLFGRSR